MRPRGGRRWPFESAISNVASWLGPWHVQGRTANILGVVVLVSVSWDLMVVLYGQTGLARQSELGLVVAVAGYPVLAAGVALAYLRGPGWSGSRSWMALPLVPARPVLALAALLVVSQVPSSIAPHAPIYQDVTPSVICAARDVLHGSDPYLTPELRCLRSLKVSVVLATPLRAGPFSHLATYPTLEQERAVARRAESHGYATAAFPLYGYPPLSFLWMLPVAMGSRGSWAIWTLLWALAWLSVASRIAGRWWPAVTLIFLLQWGAGGLLGDAAQGNAQFFAAALLALAALKLSSPRWSAVALGLAVATSQIAWLVVPGYLVLGRHFGDGWKRLLWLGGTALLATVPWLVAYPAGVSAILKLIVQPTYPQGVGIVALSAAVPLLPMLPKPMYFAATGAVELTLLALGAKTERWAILAVVLSPAALWFSWRSELSFLGLLPLLAGAVAVGMERRGIRDDRLEDDCAKRRAYGPAAALPAKVAEGA